MTGRKLRALGFIPAGEIVAGVRGSRLRHHGREPLPTAGGLYAFVLNDQTVNDRVVYIGVAVDFRHRIVGGHCQALPASKPRHVQRNLHRALRRGGRVRVMIATPRPKSWKGIEVNTALGAEPALIAQAQPPWNVVGIEREEAVEIWSEATREARKGRRRAAERSRGAACPRSRKQGRMSNHEHAELAGG